MARPARDDQRPDGRLLRGGGVPSAVRHDALQGCVKPGWRRVEVRSPRSEGKPRPESRNRPAPGMESEATRPIPTPRSTSFFSPWWKKWQVKNGKGLSVNPHAGRATLQRSRRQTGAPTFLSAWFWSARTGRQECRRSGLATVPPERRPAKREESPTSPSHFSPAIFLPAVRFWLGRIRFRVYFGLRTSDFYSPWQVPSGVANQPGGQPIRRPPRRWTCRCGTSSPASRPLLTASR